ncbi:outer membrane protein assembly factor BamB [Piscinibacter defluvii]|uniref:outer membrane protein assembly factor BamB n=1 Tax=Piscinibacter defluvii TaxID=1796922 RepID=UPI000FDD5453|nr:outer membrane protein assembly factor BamB [Piscinibacter defluvii]
MRLRGAPLALLLAAAVLAACSSTDKPKPKPLPAIEKPIAGRQVWSARLDSVRFPLGVSTAGGVFTVASTDGTVLALQPETGREVWRGSAGERLAAGVGSDGRWAAVVTRDNELVVLEAGKKAWHKPLGTRVVTAPLVAGERVFVLAGDRSVHAFDVRDGRRLWSVQRPGDPLTLARPGLLMPFKDTLLVGQGPRLAGLDPLRGTLRWEVPMASPRGTNEVERLAELVSPAARIGDLVCARAFQSAVACANADRGNLAWSKNVGGIEGVAGDDQLIVAADASDRLSAWRTASGEVAWNSEVLMHRELGSPLMAGDTVVFGDASGTLHWLSRDSGAPLLRLATDGSGLAAAPVAIGTTLLAVTKSGGVYAFRPN